MTPEENTENIATPGAALKQKAEPRKQPEVGDTLLLQWQPYGWHEVFGEQKYAHDGAKFIEVEVKAVKTAKVTIE